MQSQQYTPSIRGLLRQNMLHEFFVNQWALVSNLKQTSSAFRLVHGYATFFFSFIFKSLLSAITSEDMDVVPLISTLTEFGAPRTEQTNAQPRGTFTQTSKPTQRRPDRDNVDLRHIVEYLQVA